VIGMTTESHIPAPGDDCRCRRESLLQWLGETREGALEPLWRTADRTRVQFVGREVGLWGTIKISNHCDEECGFCGLRAGNEAIVRYRLPASDILAAAQRAAAAGCNTVVLQSGRDGELAASWISELIQRIREATGLEVALSLGERSEAEVSAWRRAGAGAYLLRFMTANTTLYCMLHACPCEDPRRRLPLLATLRQLGYRVGSGVLLGFPGQGVASVADDLEMIRTLDLDIVLASPYLWPAEMAGAHPETREGDPNSPLATHKFIALARHLCPGADIPTSAALATAGSPEAHEQALARGANVLTVDFTPAARLAEYRCYPGRVSVDENAWNRGAGGLRALVERRKQGADAPAAGAEAAPSAQRELLIGVCMGSSCFSRGNNRTVAAVQDFITGQRLGGRAVLEGHLCEGLCKDGPNVMIGGEIFQRADTAAVIASMRQRLKLKE
jgi:biotin synthase